MSFIKKLILLKNEAGLALIGLLFAVIGGIVVLSGASDGSLLPLVFMGLGTILFVTGLMRVVKELKTPAEEHKQYDRVKPDAAPPVDFVRADGFEEREEDFVFHFTGKANQSHVMKDANGAVVYEATTEKLLAIKPRPFVFRNCMNGQEETRMVSATVTTSAGGSDISDGMTISSTFKIDGQDVWDLIAADGYGFRFSLHGIAAHYDVKRWQQPAGYAELGGTGLMNPKYKDNPLGKAPTNGIFKVHCKRSDVPGFFLICFAISHTEMTIE